LNILVVQHDVGAPAGLIGAGIESAGGKLLPVMPHRGEALPDDPTAYDGMLLLGGPMSAADDAGHPYYSKLFRLIRDFDRSDKPVMGICLGSQLIARAWGALVYPNAVPEFGFLPITMTAAARHDAVLGGLSVPALMQFHYDTFDLPSAATLLATGTTCTHQAYRIGRVVWGFQFHLEVTPEIVREWARLPGAPAAAGGVDPVALTERQMADHMNGARDLALTVARRWMERVADRRATAA